MRAVRSPRRRARPRRAILSPRASVDDFFDFLAFLCLLSPAIAAIAVLVVLAVRGRLRIRFPTARAAPPRRTGPLALVVDDPHEALIQARTGLTEAFEGVLASGRRASVSFQGFRDPRGERPVFKLDVPGAPLVSLRRSEAIDGSFRGERRVRMVAGLVVAAGDRDLFEAERALDRIEAARELVTGAFRDFPLERVLVWDGKLTAFLAGPLPGDAYAWLLGTLDAIATAAAGGGGAPVQLTAVERARVVVATGPRCPYCHGAIEPSAEDVVPCDRCGTPLHGDCFHELGRCPVLGCGGGPSRERVRARG